MFFDAQQAQQAVQAIRPQPQRDPVVKLTEDVVLFLVGRKVGGWLKNRNR